MAEMILHAAPCCSMLLHAAPSLHEAPVREPVGAAEADAGVIEPQISRPLTSSTAFSHRHHLPPRPHPPTSSNVLAPAAVLMATTSAAASGERA